MKKDLDTPFKYHEERVVKIEKLTNEGRGIARVDGWIVMVPFVLPEETVRVRIFKNHKNYSEADLLEVITPSEKRRNPLCPLFTQCGGCQYQHMDYEDQLHWKQVHVQECFERIGRLKVSVKPVCASSHIYGYRTKLTPHFQTSGEGIFPIGFLAYGRTRQLVDVEQCVLGTPAINDRLRAERERLQKKFAGLGKKVNGTLLLRDTGEEVLTDPNALALTTVCGQQFFFPAGSFFQNNPYVLELIVAHIEKTLTELTPKYLIDAYCGVGLFALLCATKVKNFIGVEVDCASIELARKNATANNIHNGIFVLEKAENIFKQVKFEGSDTLVIMDPPRKGCAEEFLAQLARLQPRGIV